MWLFTVQSLLRARPLGKQCTHISHVMLDGVEVEQADEREKGKWMNEERENTVQEINQLWFATESNWQIGSCV